MTAFTRPRFTVACSSGSLDADEAERRWAETFGPKGSACPHGLSGWTKSLECCVECERALQTTTASGHVLPPCITLADVEAAAGRRLTRSAGTANRSESRQTAPVPHSGVLVGSDRESSGEGAASVPGANGAVEPVRASCGTCAREYCTGCDGWVAKAAVTRLVSAPALSDTDLARDAGRLKLRAIAMQGSGCDAAAVRYLRAAAALETDAAERAWLDAEAGRIEATGAGLDP